MEVSGYNLSWSTFSRHLAQLSRELHTEKYFSDLTLVSDDLVQTEAHRIILSASSPLLKSLLSISPRGQTQLFLKGVKHQQLEAVLRFLYYGEVQVPSAEIREFLRAGEELEITELRNIMEKREDERDEKMENCEEESKTETRGNTPVEDVSENVFEMKEEVDPGEIRESDYGAPDISRPGSLTLPSQERVRMRKSPIWRFFRDDPEDETKAFCLVADCLSKKVSRGRTGAGKAHLSTTVLVTHLKNHHSAREYREYLQEKKIKEAFDLPASHSFSL